MNTRVLVIDNYDSFTFNLVQALRMLGAETIIRRNDRIELSDIEVIAPTHVVISPGPGRPEGARQSMPIIEAIMPTLPVLGVCLGHQALAAVLGGTVCGAQQLMHGKSSMVYHDAHSIFAGLPNPFVAGRYHSLCVSADDLPECFTVSAYTSDGMVMGIRHNTLPAEGVQFHPESILTPDGPRLLSNFLRVRPNGGVA